MEAHEHPDRDPLFRPGDACPLIAALIRGLSTQTMADLPLSPEKLRLYSYHKWIGMTVLLLFLLCFMWRFVSPPPALLPGPVWQLKLAGVAHWLL